MSRPSLAAVTAVVLGCSGASPAPAQEPTTTTPPPLVASTPLDAGAPVARVAAGGDDTRRIARMLKKVSEARGLVAKSEVPGRTLDRVALLDRVKAHVAREVPKAAIRNEGLSMKLLGLLPTNFDYEAETYALLEAQLAGYYEPADRTMYMAADLDDDNAKATLAHELVHALQDQHWDLGVRSKYKPGKSDLSATTSALAEGDATSAMFDVLIAGSGRTAIDLPAEVFTQQIMANVSSGPSARAPHAMRVALVAPYVFGTLFVHALRTKGGWPLVNRAWAEGVQSTEQILHPEKWLAKEAPLVVPAPDAQSFGAGFSELDTDTFGELGLRLTFGEWIDESRAESIARGWGGDRATLATRGDEVALALRIVYDEKAGSKRRTGAEAAFAALVEGFEAKQVGAAKAGAKSAKSQTFACFERPETGPLSFLVKERELVIVAGPTRTGASSWTATGQCKNARVVADTILGQKR